MLTEMFICDGALVQRLKRVAVNHLKTDHYSQAHCPYKSTVDYPFCNGETRRQHALRAALLS